MQIKEINVSRSVCFNIGQQYSNEVLVIHFKGLPDLPNKYIYVKKDNYEKEVPLVGDLYVVSRPLTTYSGEVKAQIIARDPGSTPIALTPNFKMMITPSNYSGIGEDENYPDDPNIKNYYVKIDGETKFNEKKMLVFGDSITDSAEISIDDNMRSNKYLPRKADANGKKMWVNIIKDMYAFSDVRNYALSGATWRKINNNPRANAPSQIELALNDMNNPNGVFPTSSFIPDIVIFAMGINDGITPSDSYESAMDKTIYINGTKNIDLDATIANLDVTKFNESVRYSLLTIKKNFPLATVFVSLPLQCMKQETVSTSKLVDDIRKMAKRCGCIVIESTNESGIIPEGNFYNSEKEGITLLDGLHPNASGQKLLARCILKDLLTKYIPINFN